MRQKIFEQMKADGCEKNGDLWKFQDWIMFRNGLSQSEQAEFDEAISSMKNEGVIKRVGDRAYSFYMLLDAAEA